MKILTTVAGSRAGVDFFASLLDQHPEIIQFPGTLRANNNLINILSQNSLENVALSFYKNYQHFFDSRIKDEKNSARLERHDCLGDTKKEYYLVNYDKFFKKFIEISKHKFSIFKNNQKIERLINIHKAYCLASGENINEKKIIIIHLHLIKYLFFFEKKILDSSNFTVIHTIRYPLSAINSPLSNWLNSKYKFNFTPRQLFYHLDLIVNGIKEIYKINRKIIIIKLESLHNNNYKIMCNFSKAVNIKYNSKMSLSTFHNLKWWGDEISRKDLNGVNPNFKISYDIKNFFTSDIAYLETILYEYIDHFGYPKIQIGSKKYYKFLPLKCEILTWRNTLQSKRLRPIISIIYFYLKRICCISSAKIITENSVVNLDNEIK